MNINPASTETLPLHSPEPDNQALLGGSDDGDASSTALNEYENDADIGELNPDVTKDPTTPPPQPRTCDCAKGGSNLVVCIDGTSNQFGDKNSNVIELYKLIEKEGNIRQRTYYNSGIGTYAEPSWKSLDYYKQVIGHKVDLAFALRFESIVLDAYRWISETYEKGDRIFLFGFSRGAYQVRTLSAMIDKVGLIHRGNEKQIPFRIDDKAPLPADKASTFKETFSRKVKVHFVGAWDTVSSVGIMRGAKLLPGTANGMRHACHFRHALALDECRVKFLPEYASARTGPQPTVDLPSFSDSKEVWFAGSHSDIGGGNVDNATLNNTRPALRWMFTEASTAGLSLHPFEPKPHDKDISVYKSLAGIWWLLEYLPIRRPIDVSEEEDKGFFGWFRHHLHRGAGRILQQGQKIHPSVWLSKELGVDYKPCAYFPADPEFWTHRRLGQTEEPGADGTYTDAWKEVDLYDMVAYFVERYTANKSFVPDDDGQRAQLNMMNVYARSEEGRRALIRELVQRLELGESYTKPERKPVNGPIVSSIFNVILKNSHERPVETVGSYRAVKTQLRRHLLGQKDLRIVEQFLVKFTDPPCRVLTGHEDGIRSIALSPHGEYLVSGARDGLVRVWDMETGLMAREPYNHGCNVHGVAFSSDGRHFASSSYDFTIRIWDMEAKQPQEAVKLEGHYSNVYTVAFSHDGKRIVSGSDDWTVRIWDAETGQPVGKPFTEHDQAVFSVAFSPDGKTVASGSWDCTIKIRDVETRRVIQTFKGHSGGVFSVAFSSDGKYIVSGSDDHAVWVWDMETGERVREFTGHQGTVWSVAFSSDDKRVVSGSNDKTIRVWDMKSGQSVGMPFVGHSGEVNAVAFLPDGKVVSGSGDRTIRVWEII